jgi:hypothetical protein
MSMSESIDMHMTWIGHGMDMGFVDLDVGKKLSSKANIMSDRSSRIEWTE